MAKIIDADLLVRSTTLGQIGTDGNIFIDTTLKKISLDAFGSLTTDGVTLQTVYSYLKEEWKNDSALIKFEFPMISITEESFELINGWDFKDTATNAFIRDGGWALKDTGGVSEEEYANITTLGSFNNSGTDLAYYIQVDGGTPTDIDLAWEVNEAVKIYWDASHGNFDYRDTFKIFLREQAKNYDVYDLLVEQTLSALTYKKYAMPLSNSLDLKVTENDVTVDAYGVDITYYGSAQVRSIDGSNYNFSVIIDGNNKTTDEIYMAVQSALRKTTDIDEGAGTVRGDTADDLLIFVWDTLETKLTSTGGVYIDNFQATDTNDLVFVDDTNARITYDFVSAGTVTFNTNLVNDTDAIYSLFFTDANGNEFGTSSAIIVEDNSTTAISWVIGGASEITFDFDYDGNVQGGRTTWVDASVTLVAIWLSTWQYVAIESTITRSVENTISVVSGLERNYSNPA